MRVCPLLGLATRGFHAILSGMLFFFALSCLAAATFGSVVLYQRGERRRLEAGGVVDPRLLLPESAGASGKRGDTGAVNPKPPERVGEPTLENLLPGDIVDDGEADWVVAGVFTYREERDQWRMYALDGGARRRFLEVRRRGGSLVVAFVEPGDGLPSGQLMHGLTHAGRSYQLDVRGDARVTLDGDGFGRGAGTLAYARYLASGALLLIEDEGQTRRAYVGESVPPSALSFMSGELNRG